MPRTVSLPILAAAILALIPLTFLGQTISTQAKYVETAHRLVEISRPEDFRHMYFGDVELLLNFCSSEEADTVFKAVVNTRIHMQGRVIETGKDWIRVSWDHGVQPPLQSFRFEFKEPLIDGPHPGQTINLEGTYSSYTRDPLRITLTSSLITLR